MPTGIDAGFVPSDITKEWLEQVINSNIRPRLDDLYINQVELPASAPGKVLYVVEIPQSVTRPPHQANDLRYYKRHNFEVLAMEDYEIRDIMNRSRVPDLDIEVKREPFTGDSTGGVRLRLYIWNRGQVIAKYVSCVCDILESHYQMSSDTYVSYHPVIGNRWIPANGSVRSAQLLPDVNSVAYPGLPFDVGGVKYIAESPHSCHLSAMCREAADRCFVVQAVPPSSHCPPLARLPAANAYAPCRLRSLCACSIAVAPRRRATLPSVNVRLLPSLTAAAIP